MGKRKQKDPIQSHHDWQQNELRKYTFSGTMMGIVGDQELMIPIQGMTKREYYASKAMQAFLSDVNGQREIKKIDCRFTGKNFAEVIAMNAVEFADALLKQLES